MDTSNSAKDAKANYGEQLGNLIIEFIRLGGICCKDARTPMINSLLVTVAEVSKYVRNGITTKPFWNGP